MIAGATSARADERFVGRTGLALLPGRACEYLDGAELAVRVNIEVA